MTAPTEANRGWLANAIVTVVLWGVWGAFAGLSPERGFPETLVYCVWAITMIPPALIVLRQDGWRLDHKPFAIGKDVVGRSRAHAWEIGLRCLTTDIHVPRGVKCQSIGDVHASS